MIKISKLPIFGIFPSGIELPTDAENIIIPNGVRPKYNNYYVGRDSNGKPMHALAVVTVPIENTESSYIILLPKCFPDEATAILTLNRKGTVDIPICEDIKIIIKELISQSFDMERFRGFERDNIIEYFSHPVTHHLNEPSEIPNIVQISKE